MNGLYFFAGVLFGIFLVRFTDDLQRTVSEDQLEAMFRLPAREGAPHRWERDDE